jgi:xanthine dehydrogenase accessory factor
MDELFRHLDYLRRTERRVAMATLVATRGTTPKKEGAKMWVGEGGRVLGSVTIGGCVDARVIAESEEVLATARPRLLSLSLGEADAWDFGLTCSGTVDVLVEPVDLSGPDDAVVRAYEVVRRETAGAGRQAAIITPLAGPAGAPPGAARRLVVLDDGTTVGTLGDAALDEEARGLGLAAMRDGQACTMALRARGEPLEAFVELHGPPATLVVFGATHVAIPLVAFAKGLGWRTVVVDGRERFATRERFPDADEIRVGILGDIAEQLAYGTSTFVVLTAHDYKYELPVLRAVLPRGPAYIGLLGSRRRGEALRDFLRQEGVGDETLRRVHVPIGLDIGARTAAEIALSILAEAVAVRSGRNGAPMARRGGA